LKKERLLVALGISFAGLVVLVGAFIAYKSLHRETYAVYGVIDPNDCSSPREKTPRLKMRFLVSETDRTVVVRYTLSDGKKGFSKLEQCTVRDRRNWQCGGANEPEAGIVTAKYAMTSGVLSYSLQQGPEAKTCEARIQVE